jgi:hypothetical protein
MRNRCTKPFGRCRQPAALRRKGHETPRARGRGRLRAGYRHALSLNGRVYHFKNGHCVHDAAAKLALEIDLGTAVVGTGTGNAGEPYLAITAESATVASLSANYGGHQLVSGSLIKIQSHGLLTGTFKSSFTLTAPFTGTWDCHGSLSAY